jgi:hypothetical protein
MEEDEEEEMEENEENKNNVSILLVKTILLKVFWIIIFPLFI